jgi:signal transduction histidine kinase
MKISIRKIFFFICIIIVATICLQVYWNYKNYISNKNRLSNEIQIAYDKSLEIYFNEESKNEMISFISDNKTLKSRDFIKSIVLDSVFKSLIKTNKPKKSKTSDTVFIESFEDNNMKVDTQIFIEDSKVNAFPKNASIKVLRGKKAQDEIGGIEQFPNRFVITISSDSIKYKVVDSIFETELKRKNIRLNYGFRHIKNDTLFNNFSTTKEKLSLNLKPKSSFFKPSETMLLDFNHSNSLLFQRMGSELLLSLIFLIAVISCLFFMLRIINKQKKIDEIKNDFINNITHEFKTPITTISTALEGMSNFNPTNDIEKNKKYISISINQLSKLESMVEKILETATLNTEELRLNREQLDLIPFISAIVEKHKTITDKEISLSNELNDLSFYGDAFYLENVFSNLIDNAIKYGGEIITITPLIANKNIIIDITDNGNTISKNEEKAVFDKFYRIPKGNVHDVKGYGIGLYFSKIIIEKHGGSITLIRTNETTFRITLPYES